MGYRAAAMIPDRKMTNGMNSSDLEMIQENNLEGFGKGSKGGFGSNKFNMRGNNNSLSNDNSINNYNSNS